MIGVGSGHYLTPPSVTSERVHLFTKQKQKMQERKKQRQQEKETLGMTMNARWDTRTNRKTTGKE